MSLDRFERPVNSAEELASLIGTPSELAIKKQLPELDSHMIAFIADSPFFLLGTVGLNGTCDVSPRGDTPGSAKVLDPKTLVLAERRGNRRADSLRNVIETGRIGLLFLIPGLSETLRVNGRARVIRDEAVLESLAAEGKTPLVAIAVEVEECFLQCGKAILRSNLWEGRAGKSGLDRPCFAEILLDQTKLEGETVESLQATIEESYTKNLY